ncbi:MAG: ParD-like family protein [Caulobacter sp.]
MGIVNIEDELHEQLRRASKASYRSINGQAAFWIRIGMLCELNPHLTFQELVARELREAGVDADPAPDEAAPARAVETLP